MIKILNNNKNLHKGFIIESTLNSFFVSKLFLLWRVLYYQMSSILYLYFENKLKWPFGHFNFWSIKILLSIFKCFLNFVHEKSWYKNVQSEQRKILNLARKKLVKLVTKIGERKNIKKIFLNIHLNTQKD